MNDAQLAYRDKLQQSILVEIMRLTKHGDVVLKGGMAMRTLLKSTRYTKDIDLDSAAKAMHAAQIIKRGIQAALESFHLANAAVHHAKNTNTVQRFKVLGNLPDSTVPINLTVELSLRPSIAAGHTTQVPLTPPGGGEPVYATVLDAPALAATKILAFLDENRCAPRDLYDLSILLDYEKGADPSDILAELPLERLQGLKERVYAKADLVSFDLFDSEVGTTFPPQQRFMVTPEDFPDMQIDVAEGVERWLDSAIKKHSMRNRPGTPGDEAESEPAPAAPRRSMRP
jgi:predicted nucleotidyltransferase component of viral defense system